MRDSSLHPIRPLNLDDAFSGRELLVVGCTGFLGKVMLAMLLERLPTVRKIHVVLRVPGGVAPEHRLWRGVLDSGAFASLRASLGRDFEPVLRDKLVALAGDVARPLIGLSPAEVAGMRGRLSAIVNVAGIVDFDPPLDLALEVNAHGVRHLVELSHQLGGVPLLHTSTCFVAGDRQGFVEERDPRLEPFARGALAGVGGDWSPEEELRSCQRLIEAERVRLDEGHHRDDIERDAREALVGEGTLFSPRALEAARARARRKLARRLLVAAGMRRARALGLFQNKMCDLRRRGASDARSDHEGIPDGLRAIATPQRDADRRRPPRGPGQRGLPRHPRGLEVAVEDRVGQGLAERDPDLHRARLVADAHPRDVRLDLGEEVRRLRDVVADREALGVAAFEPGVAGAANAPERHEIADDRDQLLGEPALGDVARRAGAQREHRDLL